MVDLTVARPGRVSGRAEKGAQYRVQPSQPPILDDARIAALLAEPKTPPGDWRRLRPQKREARHMRGEVEVQGARGGRFRLFTRQHERHPLNFTAGLVHVDRDGHEYRLLRCDGLHPGGHVNHVEDTRFGTSFHVHRATERYQRAGLDIDGYAEQTDAFTTLDQAVTHLCRVASVVNAGGATEPML